MAAHPRLGADTASAVREVAASTDLLMNIMNNIELFVPGDAPTLPVALRRAAPWQRIVLGSGEHLVSAADEADPGSSVLRLSSPVRLRGEPGAIVRGTIILDPGCAGGEIVDLRLDDGGDCCLRCQGGVWNLERLRLRCSHAAALFACGDAKVRLVDCILGGEGENELGKHVELSAYGSVQVHGLAKRACYGMVVRDRAEVVVRPQRGRLRRLAVERERGRGGGSGRVVGVVRVRVFVKG